MQQLPARLRAAFDRLNERAFDPKTLTNWPKLKNLLGSPAARSYIIGAMHLELTDDEAATLVRELNDIIDGDRYFLSPRIKTLRAIRAKLRPEPVREPLPPPKIYAPARATLARKGRAGR